MASTTGTEQNETTTRAKEKKEYIKKLLTLNIFQYFYC